MKYLLDVNALTALLHKSHVHHATVEAWAIGKKLAICPITELGFLRISSHPRILRQPMADARKLLEDFISRDKPDFVSADLRALDSQAADSDAVTDAYLAQLAGRHNMRFATFDQGISHPAVEVIS